MNDICKGCGIICDDFAIETPNFIFQFCLECAFEVEAMIEEKYPRKQIEKDGGKE